jgi:hypothetical protein
MVGTTCFESQSNVVREYGGGLDTNHDWKQLEPNETGAESQDGTSTEDART